MKITGLTSQQVQESLEKHGNNKFTEQKRDSFFEILLEAFKDKIIIILMFALIVQTGLALFNLSPWIDIISLAVAISLATGIAAYSEYTSGNAFAKIKEDASKILVKVIRDGELQEIMIDDIVLGDIVKLQTGDTIPADGILVDGHLTVDQAMLNGEAEEVEKLTRPEGFEVPEISDTHNKYLVYRGSGVESGEAYMEVTEIGMKTVLGQVAESLQEEDAISPLTLKLDKLAGQITTMGYVGGSLGTLSFLFMEFTQNGFGDFGEVVSVVVQGLIIGITIIIVAVPEGLPLMISLVLALNSNKMFADHILVKKDRGVEAAGNMQILFSDKTGTITKGKLEVTQVVDGSFNKYTDLNSVGSVLQDHLKYATVLNTNAVLKIVDGEQTVIGGNMTESAIVKFFGNKEDSNGEIITHYPFNSTSKFSSSDISLNGKEISVFKGAPERLLPNITKYLDTDGTEKELDKEKLDVLMNEFAEQSYRLLMLAYAPKLANGEMADELVMIGMLTIRDDVRPEAVEAIADVQQAGVQVVMITGDKYETAIAIAKESGLFHENSVALTSDQLAQKTDDEVKEILPNLSVIARALPSDKQRLVKLSQEMDLIVGMTGKHYCPTYP